MMSKEELDFLGVYIQAGIDDMDFNNIHLVAKLMYEILDEETITGLIDELEANIQFGGNYGSRIK
jgi:hypothetical protein